MAAWTHGQHCGSADPAWWQVMGYDAGPPGSLVQVEQRFRRLALRAHPDRGGSAEQMQRLLRGRAQARRQLTTASRHER